MTLTHPAARPATGTPPTRGTADGAGSPGSSDRRGRLLDTVVPRLLLVAVPALVVWAVHGPVGDPDTFWHLRAGEQLLRTWSFLPADDWSAFNTRPWVLHEWAPEVLLALAARVDGLAGVVVLRQVGLVLVVAAVLALCRSRGTLLQALIGTTVAVVGLAPSLGPRPQLVSFALLAVTVRAWLASADDRRPRWWLVGLTWVWACCHGFWVLGPLVGAVLAVGVLLDERAAGRDPRSARPLLLVPVLAGLAGLLTPVGYRTLTAAMGVGDTAQYVTEWAAPSLRTPTVAVPVLALAAVAVVWARRRRSWSWVRVGLWLAALLACLLALRTVAVGAVLLAPLVTEALRGPADPPAPRRLPRVEGALLAGTALVVLVASLLTASDRAARVPTGLDAALDALPAGTVVYDWYDVGGWLDWAHPDLSLVVDGRTELFNQDYLDRYQRAAFTQPGWQDAFASYGATAAVLPVDSPLADALVDRSGWRVVAVADGYRLLRHP
ncbi:hypothetical protein [Lapillicoccus jejuensis]|uniref:Dolichyl-phosphate-mannose-protein mannosyltransferase n=1 Tax=Lapillicoccus jejuensis TaxID=402171 RepID=A0A542E2H2_9MICO|nr:hypothetical protein [Lapillicoccus jejuensis]TQJ09533.1 hypothetical protein FB458_2645 [Lapillicoccus jejuensis]